MTTIVNNPTSTDGTNGVGFLIGVLVMVGFGILFFYFGLPAIRNMAPIQLNVPAPQVIMPDKIDVDIQQSK
ncbi:MAG: hypothetical protein NUV52_04445 [Candidatus Roizmanbacteria bacterium]|nr:hypothetical protein [Candidatus Roizmanbacteria bacterium]